MTEKTLFFFLIFFSFISLREWYAEIYKKAEEEIGIEIEDMMIPHYSTKMCFQLFNTRDNIEINT